MDLNPGVALLHFGGCANDPHITIFYAFVVLDWYVKQEFLQQ
jgi:hypothetical protein